MSRLTNFKSAVHYCHNSLILCNNIPNFDESIWNNMRFSLEEGEEIFQYFITDCSESDVEFLEKSFSGMYFTYSEVVEAYILCVTHWGTSWDYVMVDVLNEDIPDGLLKKEGEE